jgi:hypothetical protein
MYQGRLLTGSEAWRQHPATHSGPKYLCSQVRNNVHENTVNGARLSLLGATR